MFRTEKTVGMLRTIALIAGLAILLWSLGLPSLKFATAASVTDFSDTITDSAPGAASDHVVAFTMSDTGSVSAGGGVIDVTFPADFTFGSLTTGDVNINVGGSNDDANWTVTLPGSNVVRLTAGAGGGAASLEAVIIKIGTSTANQISNPASPRGGNQSYEITVSAGTDTGSTRVVILDTVEITASVDTIFTFAVAGVGGGTSVNGDTTTGTTSSTSIPFGTLTGGSATTSAQQLTVNTNASNGYVVTVQVDQPLQSSTGGVIDGFANGSDTDTPSTWAGSPLGADINDATTWGHWGFTSDDATTTRDAGDEFDSQEYAAASTTPRVVMSHDGPANGAGTGVGVTYVGYKVEITNLQEAGDDYSTTLTYIATPTF
jgi:hypothetical protein